MQRWKTGKTIYYTTMFVATVFFYSVTGFLIYLGITLSFAVLASVVALSYYQVDADTRCGEFSGGATCGSGTTMMEWAGMGPEGAAVQAWLVGGLGRMLAEYVVLVVVAFGVASRFGSGTPHQVPSRHTTLYAYVDFAYTTLGFAVVQVQLLFRVVLGLLMLLVYIPRVDCSVLVGDASAWDPGFKAYVPHAAGAARGLRVACAWPARGAVAGAAVLQGAGRRAPRVGVWACTPGRTAHSRIKVLLHCRSPVLYGPGAPMRTLGGGRLLGNRVRQLIRRDRCHLLVPL